MGKAGWTEREIGAGKEGIGEKRRSDWEKKTGERCVGSRGTKR